MSNDIRSEDFNENLFTLLEETFERNRGAYLDKGAGWFATLEGVSAEEASTPAGPEGTTIAGQVAHTHYYIASLLDEAVGKTVTFDWPGSWRQSQVDGPAWEALKQDLKDVYARAIALFRSVKSWSQDPMGTAMVILTHSAYHLGSVRQMIKVVR